MRHRAVIKDPVLMQFELDNISLYLWHIPEQNVLGSIHGHKLCPSSLHLYPFLLMLS